MALVAFTLLAITACDKPDAPKSPASSRTEKAATKPKVKKRTVAVTEGKPVKQSVPATKPAPPPRQGTFENLLAQAEATNETPIDPLRFTPVEVNEAMCQARGIRKLTGKHLTLYTDVAAAPAVDELPQVFDLALPQWLDYFGIDAERATKWHVVGVLAKEKERFFGTGLWPDDLPPFLHGYMRDNNVWLYEQPSDFYRRHLLLHEGTHGFMWAFLGGLGAPWYTEGMAELLGTHRWEEGKLTLNVIPPSKESSPLWGRVKVLRDHYSANKAFSLPAVMKIEHRAFQETDPYAWCWGAAVFFDHDPHYQKAFREATGSVTDVSSSFSERLLNRLPQPLEQVGEQWQCFVANMDYGYDVARESIVRQADVVALENEAKLAVAADRGWQSSGYALQAGTTYAIEATGSFQIGESTKPWISEADGITIKYYRGHPIGMLLAAVTNEGKSGGATPLLTPLAIGGQGKITPTSDGVLYFRLNDAPNSLADNAGELSVQVTTVD